MTRVSRTPLLLAAFACIGFVACQKASARQTTQGTATKAVGLGSLQCEKYFRMVTACIDSKVPEIERTEKKQELAYVRSILERAPMSGIADFCETALRDEMQKDTYGCYGAEAAKAGLQTPCSLMTSDELRQIVGAPVSEPKRDESDCLYQVPPSRYVKLEVHWKGGRDELQAARDGMKIVDKQATRTEGFSLVEGQKVDGLGDDAFFVVAGIMPWLYVRKGDTAVQIEAYGGTQEQMMAVARIVLARLR